MPLMGVARRKSTRSSPRVICRPFYSKRYLTMRLTDVASRNSARFSRTMICRRFWSTSYWRTFLLRETIRKEEPMPVIEKPKNRGALFGGRTQVMFGPGLGQQLREKRERERQSAPAAPNHKGRAQ